jgi:hypothetical protein
MVTGNFKHGKHTIPMTLGYVLAHGKLFDLGLDILSMTKDNSVIQTIMLDDSVMLKVWFYYIQQHDETATFDEALEILDESPKGLEPFRKAFWELVVGFMPTALQPTLRELWRQAEKQLKNAPEKMSTTSTSPLPEEQE